MAFQNAQNNDASLVLSCDAKPRLKWTAELHQRFIDAVNQLGGADKATPKSLMKAMSIHGLTLYHLKSHLQKYRLAKSQQSPAYNQNRQEDYKGNQRSRLSAEVSDGADQNQINESFQIAQALQMQMEVQRKLHEQIEVQRHLQLRIEAQGKYLQSVLRKAQETLVRYNSSSIGVELAKAELSQLASMVDTGCPSSSLSASIEIDRSLLKDSQDKQLGASGCSLESSITSSDSSGRNEEAEIEKWKRKSAVLPLMEMHPSQENESNTHSSGKKRSIDTIVNENNAEQPSGKRYQESGNDQELNKGFNFLETLDLNRKCLNDYDHTGLTLLDLNCNGMEQLNEHV